MPTDRASPADDETSVGPGRLVNLALGLSATAAFVSVIASLPSLSSFFLKAWFSRSSLETVPPWTLVATRIGVDLWLPASVLMILTAMSGLARKLEAPRPRFTGAILTAVWVAYVILKIAMSWFAEEFRGSEAAGAIMLVVGMPLMIILPQLIAAGFIASFVQLAAIWR